MPIQWLPTYIGEFAREKKKQIGRELKKKKSRVVYIGVEVFDGASWLENCRCAEPDAI